MNRLQLGLALVWFLSIQTVCLADEPDWEQVTGSAGWQARDSAGETVFQDRLWIFGGWFDSHSPAPRDVWSSSDGKQWKLVQQEAPWKHSDLSMTLSFQNKMWLMGGWFNGRLPDHSAGNEVWSSGDGVTWKQVTPAAGWSPRLAAAVVEFQGRIWILGGTEDYYFGDSSSIKNDVWSSEDGEHWKQVTAKAPWAPRAFHQAAVLNDRIYLFGGGNYQPAYLGYHDVWSSADGEHWQQETATAPWHERIWFSTAVYRDHLWVLGGWSNSPYRNWNDVWYSRNGRDWNQLKTKTIWPVRHEHSTFVLNDRLWVAGGLEPPLHNDVWSLHLPENWTGSATPEE